MRAHDLPPLPDITRNGSSPRRLEEAAEVARLAIDKAIECLRDTVPNARDYLVLGDYVDARTAHERHVRQLVEMAADMATLVRHCRRAQKKEKAR